jgi:hypothetical protein
VVPSPRAIALVVQSAPSIAVDALVAKTTIVGFLSV